MSSPETPYRSDNLLVRRIPAADRSRWVVTFDNYGAGRGFDRPAFGEAHLKAAGLSAVHVMGAREDWYQYPDIGEAMAAVRAATADAARVMTYGSSMGGYAALRLADAAGATSALALSPQYSADPARVPFEQRWLQDGRRIAWRPEIDGRLQCRAQAVVAYDPLGDDGRHADLIAAEIDIVRLPLPRCGHPVSTVLAEMGLLARMVVEVLDGTFDAERTAAAFRAGRRKSAAYLTALADAQPDSRSLTALTLAERARDILDSPLARISQARRLSRLGRHDEALAVHEAVARDTPGVTPFMVPHADALAEAGRMAEALALAEAVIALAPDVAHLRLWRGVMLWRDGQAEDAREAVAAALALDPAGDYYREVLALYQAAPTSDAASDLAQDPTPGQPSSGSRGRWRARWMQRLRSLAKGARPARGESQGESPD